MSGSALHAPRHQRGFTLIEVLVAIGIFAIMAAMAYGGLNALINDKTHLEAAQQRLGAIKKAVFRLQMDLQNFQDRPIRDSFGRELPALLYTPELGLEFTTGGQLNPMQLSRSSLQRVAYRIQEDADSGHYRLLRLRWARLDRSSDDQPEYAQVLLADIDKLEWRFLSGEDDWHTQWPENANTLLAGGSSNAAAATTASNRLPRAVELRMTLPDYGELRFVFMVTTPPNINATPSTGTPPAEQNNVSQP